jgi:P-type conjugative transfer ATPase TrbB
MLNQNREKFNHLKQKLWREYGDVITESLASDEIIEIMLNPDGGLWVQHKTHGLIFCGYEVSAIQATNLVGTIASLQNKIINEEYPILECELPFLGHRFEALIPPIVSSPIFCIRKKAKEIFSLNDYVNQHIISHQQAQLLREAIYLRKNVVVIGGSGTGKTTFANALLREMAMQCGNSQRIIVLEDTRELQSGFSNTVFLQTEHKIDFHHLLRAALRLRPDRICMGECRGVEMLTLLKCWNTSTPGGLTTLHANSASAALNRIQEMAAESGYYPKPQLIVESINIIVSLSFHPTKGRVVNDISEVAGYSSQDFQLHPFISGSPLCTNGLSFQEESILG